LTSHCRAGGTHADRSGTDAPLIPEVLAMRGMNQEAKLPHKEYMTNNDEVGDQADQSAETCGGRHCCTISRKPRTRRLRLGPFTSFGHETVGAKDVPEDPARDEVGTVMTVEEVFARWWRATAGERLRGGLD